MDTCLSGLGCSSITCVPDSRGAVFNCSSMQLCTEVFDSKEIRITKSMKLYPGDILKLLTPWNGGIKCRVREIELYPHWTESQYVLQLFTVVEPGVFEWMDRSHDFRFTFNKMVSFGLFLLESAKVQIDMFDFKSLR